MDTLVVEGQPSLRRYLDVVRQRVWFVLLAVLLCGGVGLLYVLTAEKVYEAHADMLVTPVPDEQNVLGLGLIRRASDPTRDVTTAARLIGNIEVARRVARQLRSSKSPQSLLEQIRVEPVAQSSIVTITASAGSPREAMQLANGFGAAAVAERTAQLHRELDPAIENMRSRIEAIDSADADERQPLFEQLAALESLRSGADPTIRLETPANAPTDPVAPRMKLTLAAALLAGLLLGTAGAFVLNALDTRGPREDRLRQLGLTVLANVPDVRRGRGIHAFEEAFRFLRTMIRFASSDEPFATVAVTSASEQEGKTTTSYQLAMAAVEAGQTVLLVEADPYRPSLRRMIEADQGAMGALDSAVRGPGLLDYLSGDATLDQIVRRTAVPGLGFVPAGSMAMTSVTGLLEQAHGKAFTGELSEFGDLVVLDCPPVGPRSDAVLIAAVADAVLLVVDTDLSTEKQVTEAVRRLRSARSNLIGVVLNRDDSSSAEYYYDPAPQNGSRRRRSRFRSAGRASNR